MIRTSPVTDGGTVTGARCGQPVKLIDKPGRDDFSEVCWRPLGHAPGRHSSRWAYLRDLRRNYGRPDRHLSRRKMTVPPGKPGS